MIPSKPKAPNLRTLAQQGSQWQLTQDVPVYGLNTGATYPYGFKDWNVIATIAAGEKVSVASKKTTTWGTQNGQTLSFEGLWVDLQRDSDKKVWCIQFSDFNKNPTMLSAPEVIPFFALRNTATGRWYSESTSRWNGGGYESTLHFDEKSTKARKFKRLADARAHMLIMGGYYEGLPDTGNFPQWMRTDRTVKWPDTIEIVEIDKVTKQEVRTLETAEHQSKMWRLRDLTMAFGPSTRAMYKKLEDKNQLGEYPVMVFWRNSDKTDDWDYEMDTADMDAIKAIKKLTPKGQTVFIKSSADACLACSNEGIAWAATQFYQGKLMPHVVSLTTLLECVPTNTSTLQTRIQQAPDTLDLPDLEL